LSDKIVISNENRKAMIDLIKTYYLQRHTFQAQFFCHKNSLPTDFADRLEWVIKSAHLSVFQN
jgi:hypothetical protein